MNDNLCELILILDASGSMYHVRSGTLEGINSFVREQNALPGEAVFTLVEFNIPCRTIIDHVPLCCVGEINDYNPNGMTALYDAVCKTIDAVGARLAATPEQYRPSKVIVGIMTDGEENSSSEFRFEDMQSRIAHQTNVYGWTFIFLGANLDDCKTMRIAGISNTTVYDASTNLGVTRGYQSMSTKFAASRK